MTHRRRCGEMDKFCRLCCGCMVFLLSIEGDVVSCAEGLAIAVALSSGFEAGVEGFG